MATTPRRFIGIWDLHWGYELRHGHKRTLHDQAAFEAVLAFAQDFKPHDLILGGDILDCGMISHHTKHRPRQRESFRLLRDAEECKRQVIQPLQKALVRDGTAQFIQGNHEAWIDDLIDVEPGLEGVLTMEKLLGLETFDKVILQGGATKLGKLWFAHGDTVRSGEHVAKAAVSYYDRNIRIGHHHSFQAFTTTSAVDAELPKSGMAVPCLCRKDPAYGEGRPNRWAQGFLWGYIFDDGSFCDYVSIITRGRFHALGKTYQG